MRAPRRMSSPSADGRALAACDAARDRTGTVRFGNCRRPAETDSARPLLLSSCAVALVPRPLTARAALGDVLPREVTERRGSSAPARAL